MKKISFLFLIFFCAAAFAQENDTAGDIKIIQDPRIETLVEKYREQQSSSIEGYRIQIAASSNRTNIYELKSQFLALYPDIKNYVVYQTPNFKLRVGNYRTRLEAYRDFQEIKEEFEGAFIINDEIKLSEL